MILFIDDEEHYVEPYIEDLRLSGYDVVLQTDVDDALKFFEQNHGRIDLLILDIMMAPGESFQHERTLAGRRTGIFFYERVRRAVPDLPVLVLTNVPNALSKISNHEVRELLESDSRCWFFRKSMLLPFELTDEVRRAMGTAGGAKR